MVKNKFKDFSICVVIFIVGLATGFWLLLAVIGKFYFSSEISLSFDPTNLVTLIVTVLLAIYITRRLEKINEQERIEKDLIIGDLKDFKNTASQEISHILNTEKISLLVVIGKLKTLRLNLNSIATVIKDYSFIEDLEILQKLDNKIRDIKDLLTDTPSVSGTGESEITVTNGELSISSTRKEKIEIAKTELGRYIFDVIAKINKK
jgi:hypothetical protein